MDVYNLLATSENFLMTAFTSNCMSLALMSAVSITSWWLGGSLSESCSMTTMLVMRESPTDDEYVKKHAI